MTRSAHLLGLVCTALVPWLMLWQGATMQALLGDGDAIFAEIPWRIVVAQSWLDGSPPLWTSLLHAGAPLAANIQVGAWYPPTLLFGVLPPALAHNVHALLHLSLAGCGVYLLLREQRLVVAAALLAAITLQCSGFYVFFTANTGVLATIAWLPVLLWLTQALTRSGHLAWRAALSLACYCLLVAGHPQFTALSFMVFAGHAAMLVLQRERGARAAFVRDVAWSAMVGVLLAAVQLLPTIALFGAGTYAQPMSFDDFATTSLSPWQQLGAALSRRLSASTGATRGSEVAFIGYVPLLLAGGTLLLLRQDRRLRWWWLLAAIGVLLTAGQHTPLARLLYELPGAGLIRAASRQWLFALMAITVLAGYGAHRLLVADGQVASRLPWGKGVLLGCLLLLAHTLLFRWVAQQVGQRFYAHCAGQATSEPWPLEIFNYLARTIPENRFLAGVIATLFVVSVGGLVWWLRRWRGQPAAGWLLLAITAFHFQGNMWTFSMPAAQFDDFLHKAQTMTVGVASDAAAEPSAVAPRAGFDNERAVSATLHWATVEKRVGKSGPWRETFLASLGPVTNLYSGIASVGGWGRLTRLAYAELVGIDLAGIVRDLSVFGPDHRALDLLNVRYVGTWAQNEVKGLDDASRYRLVRRDPATATALHERRTRFGPCWLVEEVRFLPASQIAAVVRTGRGADGQPIDLRRVALLEDNVAREGIPLGPSSDAAQVTDMQRLGQSELRLRITATTARFLVLSEVFYPGWEATIDGQAVPIRQTDVLLRGLVIPAGESEVVLRYRPASFSWGATCSLIGCLLWLAPLLRRITGRRRRVDAA